MGLMQTRCKCGCGKTVQRGSNYFLQQALCMKLGLEVIDLYHSTYFKPLGDHNKQLGSTVELQDLIKLRNDCAYVYDQMMTTAHEGPSNMSISRRDAEQVNRSIVDLILILQLANPGLIAPLNVTTRMSKPQQQYYNAVSRRM